MILHLDYTPDLTEAGILYAKRVLALGIIRASNTDLTAIRQTITDIAAELAFRRYLNEHQVPYQAAQAAPFSQPDRRVLFLAGRRCHMINTRLHPSEDTRLDLSTSVASLSATDLNSDRMEHTDLLIFSFTPLKPHPQQENSPARIAFPRCYLYLLPQSWQGDSFPGQVRRMTIENHGNHEIKLELGGLHAPAHELSLDVSLAAGEKVESLEGFSSLTYLATTNRPPAGGNISLTCGQRRLRILPEHWVKIGHHAQEILVAGYRSVGDFRQYAQSVRAARPHHTGLRLPPQAVYLPIAELSPISELF
jgi:hypothetical protein